jgi:hypothetical protein
MPITDSDLQRKAFKREYLRKLKRGDMVTLDLDMRAVAMKSGGRLMDVTPPRSAAAVEADERRRKERADREWADHCWKFYS